MALIDKLKAIGDGFRSSRGTEQEFTLDEMAAMASEPVGACEMISIKLADISDYEVQYIDSSHAMRPVYAGSTFDAWHGLVFYYGVNYKLKGTGDFTTISNSGIQILQFNSDGGTVWVDFDSSGGSGN